MNIDRFVALCVVAFALSVEAAAQSPLIGERDTARPGGVFSTLTLGDAASCARSCAADGICIAWTYLATGACELKAVAPNPVSTPGAYSGLSARAPAFARHMTVALDDLRATTVEPAPTPLAPENQPVGADVPALLGGPEGGETLRSRLGGSASGNNSLRAHR